MKESPLSLGFFGVSGIEVEGSLFRAALLRGVEPMPSSESCAESLAFVASVPPTVGVWEAASWPQLLLVLGASAGSGDELPDGEAESEERARTSRESGTDLLSPPTSDESRSADFLASGLLNPLPDFLERGDPEFFLSFLKMCSSFISSFASEMAIRGKLESEFLCAELASFFLPFTTMGSFGELGVTKELRLRALRRETPMTLGLALLGWKYVEKAILKMRKTEKMEVSESFWISSSTLSRRYLRSSSTPLNTALLTP